MSEQIKALREEIEKSKKEQTLREQQMMDKIK